MTTRGYLSIAVAVGVVAWIVAWIVWLLRGLSRMDVR